MVRQANHGSALLWRCKKDVVEAATEFFPVETCMVYSVPIKSQQVAVSVVNFRCCHRESSAAVDFTLPFFTKPVNQTAENELVTTALRFFCQGQAHVKG